MSAKFCGPPKPAAPRPSRPSRRGCRLAGGGITSVEGTFHDSDHLPEYLGVRNLRTKHNERTFGCSSNFGIS
eukprot:15435551-Alexandrium_andersonii.AAC.1